MHTNTDRALLPGQTVDQATPIQAMNGQHRRALKRADRHNTKQDMARYIGSIDWSEFDQ